MRFNMFSSILQTTSPNKREFCSFRACRLPKHLKVLGSYGSHNVDHCKENGINIIEHVLPLSQLPRKTIVHILPLPRLLRKTYQEVQGGADENLWYSWERRTRIAASIFCCRRMSPATISFPCKKGLEGCRKGAMVKDRILDYIGRIAVCSNSLSILSKAWFNTTNGLQTRSPSASHGNDMLRVRLTTEDSMALHLIPCNF